MRLLLPKQIEENARLEASLNLNLSSLSVLY